LARAAHEEVKEGNGAGVEVSSVSKYRKKLKLLVGGLFFTNLSLSPYLD